MINTLAVCLMAIWFALPFLASVASLLFRIRIHPFVLYIVATAIGCVTVCVMLALFGYADLASLEQFDLDGNGSVSEGEMTEGAQQAFDDFARGGGALESTVACTLTVFWYAFAFAMFWVPVFLVQQHKRRRALNEPAEPSSVGMLDSETSSR